MLWAMQVAKANSFASPSHDLASFSTGLLSLCASAFNRFPTQRKNTPSRNAASGSRRNIAFQQVVLKFERLVLGFNHISDGNQTDQSILLQDR